MPKAASLSLLLLPLLVPGPAAAAPARGTGAGPRTPPTRVDYRRDIQPILAKRCLGCHSGDHPMGELRLDTRAAALRGGKSGPALVPGKSGKSRVIRHVTARDETVMPPSGDRLTPRQVGLLRRWIDAGAEWEPRSPSAAAPAPQHWAFVLPRPAPLPAVKNAAWVRNPIDAFVAAEHEKRGLTPRLPAGKATLLRRVFLDLVGVPPTRRELHAFLADRSPDAYEKVVDRLLASPQYGERWARHWMDVWRYSDWYGRRAVPDVWNSAPQVWRWRDWIVRSLNRDHGYDRLVREMLAADEIAPEDDEAQVATGYLVRNWYALNPNQWMRDNVEHTGKAFLALTFNCAHCHDHKYDPIRQEDYFRLRAFFEPLQLRQDRVPGGPDPGPFQKYEYSVLRKVVESGSIRVFDEKLDAKTFLYQMGDERSRVEGKPPVEPGVPAFLGGRLSIQPVELPATAAYPGLKPFIRAEEVAKREKAVADAKTALGSASQNGIDTRLPGARLAAAEAELAALKARIAADDARYAGAPAAGELARAAVKAELESALAAARERILQAEQAVADARTKGDAAATQKAEQQLAAQKQALAAAEAALAPESLQKKGGEYAPLSPIYPAKSTGRRKALAEWIASPRNPLTARVAVNHVWKWHFGRPLVESVYDFGRNGQPPSHPELLDWMAVWFTESGAAGKLSHSPTPPLSHSVSPNAQRLAPNAHQPWSLKALHRLIVTSSTYRMESGVGAGERRNLAVDRDNRYLWRFGERRAEAEVVRDSVLAVSGELDLTLGGAPLDNKLSGTSTRRSLYFSTYPEDGGTPLFLTLFDPPDPGECYRRTETVIPQQALAMTNSALLLSQSRILARKLSEEVARGTTPAGRQEALFITAAWEQVLSRPPSIEERLACREFLRKQAALFRSAGPGLERPTKVEGQPEPSPDPEMRARESLVRALFNHNDFLMIR